ncbi:MAG: hypothetical protein KF770_16145 [Anaerolineae bacterium]|nr:hypothetical protein [Anaerolineae bacterium]
MLNGIHLTLLIGPLAVPLPAPPPLTEALQSVQVNSQRQRTGFQLTFNVGKTSLIQNVLQPAGLLDPMVTRVVIIVTFRGIPQVIADGVVTRHEVSPSNEAGQSTLTLTGEDLSVLMDVIEMRLPYPALPDAGKLVAILAKYAAFGIVPLVIPPPVDVPKSPTSAIESQTSTDLAYIRSLAARCGYTFYVEPGPLPLQNIAYFGPDIRLPVPQPALSVNSDWATNVESLSFSLDGLSKKVTIITILDPVTRKIPIPIPLPNIDILKPPLGARLTPPAKIRFSDDMANLPPDEAAKRAFGLLRQGADAVSGSGSLNVIRYGHILRARQLVGVRGAGLTYDGMYYVESVTHNIKRGEYKQSFSLSRDGVVSQTPVVMP